ncbi:MAG: DUF484 family protein [Rhodobacteraceae bacterium]|nr:DUF484 family protein [Paracoccaceae bacterium]
MAEQAIGAETRARIISEPDVILDDAEVMRALVAANERAMGANVVDLRGIAMQRLEARLDRLEDTHRAVIAAAYDNLAGMNQVHRAVLCLLEAATFAAFLERLAGSVPDMLQVDAVRLVLETAVVEDEAPALHRIVRTAEPGFVAACLAAGRGGPRRAVLLRQGAPVGPIYGEGAAWVQSEALMPLDLGAGRLPALLALASEDPHQFKPGQGTDLLAFFAGVFERAMRRWLS